MSDVGPRAALKRLRSTFGADDLDSWCDKARIEALMGSCPRSVESFKSGVRAWLEFVDEVLSGHGNAFPPSLGGLLAWSKMFRCSGTFGNYLAYVKLACELAKAPTEVFRADELRRAKTAIRKQGGFVSREKMFLRIDILESMRRRCLDGLMAVDYAMLFLFSYVFLSRLPSEALPITWMGCTEMVLFPSIKSVHAAVILANGRLGLQLARRKNNDRSSILWRSCWCDSSASTCPVHVLGKWFCELPQNSRPFIHISPGMALARMREILLAMNVPGANQYRTHDFRRGHADDMRRNGKSMVEILRMGGWSSRAFQDYMDMHAVEEDAVFEAHVCASSDSD